MSDASETKPEPEAEAEAIFSQRGSLIFEGRKAAQFWVRALDLETEVKAVQALLMAKPHRKRAAVPIVAEYTVDEKFKLIYVIQLFIDALGVRDGIGLILYASPDLEAEVYKLRDEQAQALLTKVTKTQEFDEVLEIQRKGEE
jgi:hypothetical protein